MPEVQKQDEVPEQRYISYWEKEKVRLLRV